MINVLLVTLLAALPAAAWYVLASLHIIPWPEASGPIGVGLGVAGALIIFFEMALAPRKALRGWRLGAARTWMKWHIWLGLAVLPIIVIHSGFAWGGLLSAATMVLFLIVIASGVYGLILQQVLPSRILHEIPDETVATEANRAIVKHADEARRIAAEAGVHAVVLEQFRTELLDPYLHGGARSGSELANANDAARHFARLRSNLPKDLEPRINTLEQIAGLRRQWDRQAGLHRRLHSWVLFHLPVSVLMTGLMIIHAVKAMGWW